MNDTIMFIKDLIPNLPKKDISLGYKFLDKRDFKSLQELIDSALYKIKKNIHSNHPREDYLKLDLNNIRKLKSLVDSYYFQIHFLEDDYYDNNITQEDIY